MMMMVNKIRSTIMFIYVNAKRQTVKWFNGLVAQGKLMEMDSEAPLASRIEGYMFLSFFVYFCAFGEPLKVISIGRRPNAEGKSLSLQLYNFKMDW